MTDDLIKRELQAALDAWKDLAEWVRNTSKPHEFGLHCAKVVRDRIEAQAAEIAELKSWKAAEEAHHHKLRAEIDRLIQAGDGDVGLIHWQGEEIERLREALEHIENYYGDGHRITELARAALGETE
jgi:ribosomal 50S subunit-associated protein YjgA (DUF615 family)